MSALTPSQRILRARIGAYALHATHDPLGFRFLYVGAQDVQWDNFSSLGLYYMHARHYVPALGRFLEPDPSGLETNLFEYGADSPVGAVDAYGLYHDNEIDLPQDFFKAGGSRAEPEGGEGGEPESEPNADREGYEPSDVYEHDTRTPVVRPSDEYDHDSRPYNDHESQRSGNREPTTPENVTIGNKIRGQMARRGWTAEKIFDAIRRPLRTQRI